MKKRCSKAVSFGEEPRAIIVIANRVAVRLGFMAYFSVESVFEASKVRFLRTIHSQCQFL